jgi:hypothetical protein
MELSSAALCGAEGVVIDDVLPPSDGDELGYLLVSEMRGHYLLFARGALTSTAGIQTALIAMGGALATIQIAYRLVIKTRLTILLYDPLAFLVHTVLYALTAFSLFSTDIRSR